VTAIPDDEDLTPGRMRSFVHDELDQIGQEPTQVPPAQLETLHPSRWAQILSLAPAPSSDTVMRFVVGTDADAESEVADRLIEAFSVSNATAVLVAEYFVRTAKSLSDDSGCTFIDAEDLKELLFLSLDHLLEYEHGSPAVRDTIGELLHLYETIKTEHAQLYACLGLIWERKKGEISLPLSVAEVRKAFPFPLMNPIVGGHDPDAAKKKWEGRGLPIWKMEHRSSTIVFLASSRDFARFVELDQFAASAVPDGKSVVCLVPPGETSKEINVLVRWLQTHDKLRIAELPQLLSDFLFSLGNDLEGLPGSLPQALSELANSDDVIAARKARIYEEALTEIVRRATPEPVYLCPDVPPSDLQVWGTERVKDARLATSAIALAFSAVNLEFKEVLADIRVLFKGGRDGKGKGDLHAIGVAERSGHTTLADNLLPIKYRMKEANDSAAFSRLADFWTVKEQETLADLARAVPLQSFLLLSRDQNMRRLLESFWRAQRPDFAFDDGVPSLDEVVALLENQIIPGLRSAEDLEKTVRSELPGGSIDFGASEILVKARPGFESLLDLTKKVKHAEDNTAFDVCSSLIRSFASSVNVAREAAQLQSHCRGVSDAIAGLRKAGERLKRNYHEYPNARKFVELTGGEVEAYVRSHLSVKHRCTLDELKSEARDRAQTLESISRSLEQFESKLNELRTLCEHLGEEE